MKKFCKKAIVLILSLSMCVSLMPMMVFAESDDSITYVALGDSMSQGYMFLDYTEDSNNGHYCGWEGSSSYGYIKEFAKELEEDTKKKVNLIDLTVQGEQPDEVCAFLEGYSKEQIDTMTQGARKHIGWWVGDYETDEEQDPNMFIFSTFDEMSQYFIDSIKAADIITYDIGMNYFGTYLNDKRGENETYDTLMEDSVIKSAVQSFKSLLDVFLVISGTPELRDRMDGVLYAYASYLKYTEQCLKDIYTLNPDVEIIFVPLANPNYDIYYDFDGITVNYTEIIDFVMNSLNSYIQTNSAYKDMFTIATIEDEVVSFADELYLYPDTLSEDAKVLLERAVFGNGSLLGQTYYPAPDEAIAMYDNLCENMYNEYNYYLQQGWITQEDFDEMYYGTIYSFAYFLMFEHNDAGEPIKDENGKYCVQWNIIDRIIYEEIAEKYGEDIAFKDFFGNIYEYLGDPTMQTPLTPCVYQVNCDTHGEKPGPKILPSLLADARAAVEAKTAAEWQQHIVEAVGDKLKSWESLCLKAATYRVLPYNYSSEEISIFTTERIVELLQDPSVATEDELKALHAGIRNGSAARGFGTHPCPRGLEVKHKAILAAYDTVRYALMDVDHIEVTKLTDEDYVEGKAIDKSSIEVTAFYTIGEKNTVNEYEFIDYDMNKLGPQTVTVSYKGKTATFDANVVAKSLSSISVTTKPSKVAYVVGEELDLTGMVVTAKYDNDTTEEITGYVVSGYDKGKTGIQTLTVTYEEKTATFSISVAAKSVYSLTITNGPSKLTYIEGQDLDLTGMVVTAKYNDQTTEVVTGYTISGYDKTKVGEQVVTVSFGGATVTFNVTVNAKTLSSIEMADYPNKTTYIIGKEDLVVTGAIIKLVYNNGSSENMDVTSSMVSGFNKNKLGDQTITVTYLGKTTDFIVHVTDSIKGDMNNDGEVTDKDAIRLLYHYLFPNDKAYDINQDGDMNGDKKVDDKDAIRLLYHYLFPNDKTYELV